VTDHSSDGLGMTGIEVAGSLTVAARLGNGGAVFGF
jgi:hypothetical protein